MERKGFERNRYVVETGSTEDVNPHERTEYWERMVNSFQVQMKYQFASPDTFQGHYIRQFSDNYQIVEWMSGEIACTRTPRLIDRAPDDNYRLVVPVRGMLGVQIGSRSLSLQAGAGALLCPNSPYEIRHDEATRVLCMTVPAREVKGRLASARAVVSAVDLRCGLGRVVGDMLNTLVVERTVLTVNQFDAVSDRLAELLCMVGDDRPPIGGGHLADIEASIRRYVRQHAADRDLRGQCIADALGWSLRQIQVALQRAGTTPREVIREERLRLLRRRLHDPAYSGWSLDQLARITGFSSGSAMSNAYRNRYGYPPIHARVQGEVAAPGVRAVE